MGISQILIFLHQFLGNGRFFLIFTQPYSCFVFSQEFPKIFMGTSEMILGLSRSTFMELHNKYFFHNPHRWFFISDGYIIRDSEIVNDNRNKKIFLSKCQIPSKTPSRFNDFFKSHNSSLGKYLVQISTNAEGNFIYFATRWYARNKSSISIMTCKGGLLAIGPFTTI